MIKFDEGLYLYILRPHSAHAGDPEDKAYCIQYVGFSTPVKTSNRVEGLVPAPNDGPNGVGFEAIYHELDYTHFGGSGSVRR